jgi:RNA polymerase sigma-70 factor (ECF subfamily)
MPTELEEDPADQIAAPLVEAFYLAASQGDMKSLTQRLCEDVVAYSDGGGKASAAIIRLVGRGRVIAGFGHLIRQMAPEMNWRRRSVNGQQGLVIEQAGIPQSVTTFDLQDGKIHRIYVMRNPDKLSAFFSA